MNLSLLVKRLRGGFRPFVIRLTDGRSFPIPHPDFIAVGRHAVVVVDKEGDTVYTDPLHIVPVDDNIATKNARSSRCRRRPRRPSSPLHRAHSRRALTH